MSAAASERLLSGKKAWQQFADIQTGGIPAGGPIFSGYSSGGGSIIPGLAADFKHDPGIYTLEFNVPVAPLDPAPPLNSTGIFNCLAIVNWNVEGQQIRRLITVGNAVSLSGTGQGVNVQLQDFTAAPVGGPLKYTVITTCVKGLRPVSIIPATLFGLGATVIPAASLVALAVPFNSGVNSVAVFVASLLAATQPNVIVVHRNSAFINTEYDPQKNSGFVPISPLTTIVQIRNLDPANPVTASLMWGIDG